LAIAEGPVWLRAKIQRKHNFEELPKVNCESQYCKIRVSPENVGLRAPLK